jgi:cysteine-S-conjugate beta-lyase
MNAFEGLDLDVLATRRSHKWRRYPPDVLPAFVAEMDYDLAGPVAAALRAAVDRQDCGYANESGLGEVFAGFAAVRHDWTVDPGRVYLLPDVMAGVDTMLRLATGPGDGVVINPPVYPPFYEHIAARGRTVVEVPLIGGPLEKAELDFAGLEAAFAAGARAYLLCNPHNPTGRVFSADDLRLVAELAGRYRVTVIADEIHAPLALAGARHTPFVSFAEGAAVGVTLASASKAFNIAGLKCAVAVAGSASMDRVLAAAPESLRYGAGLFGVLASEAAWTDGGPWLDELRQQLDRMRTLFGTLLAERLPGAGYVPPEAGYLAWVDCSALGLGAEPAAAFLDKGRVAVGRGLDFGAVGDGFVRVTIGTSSAILTEIVDRMAMAAG